MEIYHSPADDVLEKMKKLKTINESVKELSELCEDLNECVEEQGERLDLIEDYIKVSKENVVEAKKELIEVEFLDVAKCKMYAIFGSIPVITAFCLLVLL
jgi:t-SNARE complex subunit (syntaxin)